MSTSEDYAKMSDSAKKKEDWMNSKWRPMMGWMYMIVCIADFVVFPILWSLVQTIGDGKVESQWMPITLQGAGLFHIAMGAILGIAAYGRTQEKMAGANNGGVAPPVPSLGSVPLGGNSMSTAPSFGSPAPAPSFTPAPSPSFGSAPAPSFGTKSGPPPAAMPEL
jgi:hypothetical protein